jgi:Na+/H+-dicarboxylate symporter
MRWWLKRPLYVQIFVGLILGAVLGWLLGSRASVLKPIGDIFIRLLTMLIAPLTFFTLTSGLTRLENARAFRTLGGFILLSYALFSLISAALGLGLGLLVQPGREAVGLLDAGAKVEIPSLNIGETLVGWFPQNPVEAFAQGNMLQVIVFALFVGIGLLAAGKKAETLVRLVRDGSDLMIIITGFVMKTAPYGILALVANMVASLNGRMLREVGRFLAADMASMVLLLVVFYPLVLRFVGRLAPLRFYRHSMPAILVAGSTTSSGAALPAAMAVTDKMGVPEKVWGFSLPLGATINQNGMAAAVGVIAVFAANLYGVPLRPALLVQFIFLGLVLSFGTAGVKGSGIVVSGILLQTLNMPLTLIPILASLWPIIDIGHTVCNVTGDIVATAVVARRMDLFDQASYDGPRPKEGKADK